MINDLGVSHNHSDKEMEKYYKRIKQLTNSGSTVSSASEKAKDEMRKGKFRIKVKKYVKT